MPAERKGGDGAVHAPRLLIRVLLVLAAAAALAGTARADGDPASDYLVGQQVFFPYDTTFPAKQQAELAQLVAAANRAGFKIRVALIASSYDMGSVTSLYLKPRTYARFLGLELAFVYSQRLLVVMRNGFGFNWPHHPTGPAYATLSRIRVGPGNRGLLLAAETAVRRLAAAAGVDLTVPTNVTTPAQRNARDRIVILVAAAVAILVAGAVSLLLRRRGRKVP